MLCVTAILAIFASDQKRHVSIYVTPCDTKVRTEMGMTLTELSPSMADRESRTHRFVVATKEAGKTTVTIVSNGFGWPVDCKVSGAGSDPDGLSMMLFLLRSPLWSPGASRGSWQPSIYNPFNHGKRLKVNCRVSPLKPGSSMVKIEETTELIPVIAGMKAQFKSTIECDKMGGRALSVRINADVNAKEKNGQLMEYVEKS